jgi:predicted phage terminase large subunit-like protein
LDASSLARSIPPSLRASTLEKVQAQLAKRSLRAFLPWAWNWIEPREFRGNWHIDAICDHLEAVNRGEIRRLLINIPPRHAKSLVTSVFWPAWTWIQDVMYGSDNYALPTIGKGARFLCASYSDRLSLRDSLRTRQLVQNQIYQRQFGIKLSPDQKSKSRFDLTKGGYRVATSTGGMATGEGGDILIVDDPHNVKQAESQTVREETVRWFGEVLPTRFNDPKRGAMVVVMQRVHERDVSGFILAEDLGYTHLCYDDQTEILTPHGWVRFPELQHGVPVMAVDPKTLKGEWQVPTNYTDLPYDGDLIHYKSQTVDLMVTPDHRMFYLDKNDWKDRRSDWRVSPAKDLPNFFYLPQTMLGWDGSDGPIEYGYIEEENISRVPYQGRVYCVSVPATGVLVRRNGRVSVSGNCLPAEYEPLHPHVWKGDPRKELGELIWPSHISRTEIEELRSSLGSYAYAGQVQQRPAPREGGMFKRHWIRSCEQLPPQRVKVRAWDLAGSITGFDPDWTVGVLMSRTPEGWLFIEDIQRFRATPGEVERQIKATALLDGRNTTVVLPQDPGSAGKAQVSYLARSLQGFRVKSNRATGDKETRAGPFASQCEHGNVLMLRAPWNEELLAEICTFPNGRHDDIVDALSDAFNELAETRVGVSSIPMVW